MGNKVKGRTSQKVLPVFLLLLIKFALISIGPELDTGYPRRGPPHLLTDCIQRYIWTAFDDELVMDVPDDLAVA